MGIDAPEAADLHNAFLEFDKSCSGGLTKEEFARFFTHFLSVELPQISEKEEELQSLQDASVHEIVADSQAGAFTFENLRPVKDGIVISVSTIAGGVVWGPQAIDRAERVAALRDQLAVKLCAHPSGVQLIHGAEVLKEDWLMKDTSIIDGAELQVLLSPELIAEIGLQILVDCPFKEGDPYQFFGTELDLGPEYTRWKQERVPEVCEILDALMVSISGKGPMSVGDLTRSLVIKCLRTSPLRESEYWDSYVRELYPDTLTYKAAQLLPHVFASQHAEAEVKMVLLQWIRRCYFPGTPSVLTLDYMLKVVPELIAQEDRIEFLKELNGWAIKGLHPVNEPGDWDNQGWKVDALWRAMLAIIKKQIDEGIGANPYPAPSFLRVQPDRHNQYYLSNYLDIADREFSIKFSGKFRKTKAVVGDSESEEEDWMKDYIYSMRRNGGERPQVAPS